MNRNQHYVTKNAQLFYINYKQIEAMRKQYGGRSPVERSQCMTNSPVESQSIVIGWLCCPCNHYGETITDNKNHLGPYA